MNWTINVTALNTTATSTFAGMSDVDFITKYCKDFTWYEVGMWLVLLVIVVCKLIAGRMRKRKPDDPTVIMLYGIIDDMSDMLTAAIAALYVLLLIMKMFS